MYFAIWASPENRIWRQTNATAPPQEMTYQQEIPKGSRRKNHDEK